MLLFPIVEISHMPAIRPPATPQELVQMQQESQIEEVRFERTELRQYLKLGYLGYLLQTYTSCAISGFYI